MHFWSLWQTVTEKVKVNSFIHCLNDWLIDWLINRVRFYRTSQKELGWIGSDSTATQFDISTNLRLVPKFDHRCWCFLCVHLFMCFPPRFPIPWSVSLSPARRGEYRCCSAVVGFSFGFFVLHRSTFCCSSSLGASIAFI